MNIHRPIKTDAEFQNALSYLEDIFDASPGTKDGDDAELLMILIENYEKKHYYIGPPNPIEAIKFHMEQSGYDRSDLEDVIGYRSRISELFRGKRNLTLDMIRNLHSQWKIPLESLIAA